MTDVVSRLFYAKDYINSHLILLPKKYDLQNFRLDSLLALGVRADNILYVDKPVALIEEFVMPTFLGPSYVNPKDEYVMEIRQLYHNYFNISKSVGQKRLYVARPANSVRCVVNEQQVIELLSSKGFITVNPESLEFEDQVRLFADAEIMVGLTGAALNNMMFMHSGSPVVEFRMKDDDHNLHYFSYASAHELPYYYISCPTDGSKRESARFYVDLVELNITVDMALANHC